jgi:hypothetical protein
MAGRNYNIPELRRLDMEHHLPAQANYGEIVALGGSRIITRADGCTVWDGDGNALLDGRNWLRRLASRCASCLSTTPSSRRRRRPL